MTISAIRPVRSTDRLIDAPTIPGQRPAVEQFPINPPYRPAADRAREAYEALTAPGTTFSTLTPIARRFGITATELVELAIEYADRKPDAGVPARTMTACPPWCATTHRTVDEVLGNGLSHETVQTEITGSEPSWIDHPATVAAWVERCDEAGRVTEPARVVLTVAEGTQGHYPGADAVRGWSGTVEQVEHLGRSLLALAQVVRAEQCAPAGTAYRVDVFTADDVLMTSRTVTAADDRSAEVAARRLVDELGGAVMAAVFTASLVYVGTVTR